jgi:hypothetical protein
VTPSSTSLRILENLGPLSAGFVGRAKSGKSYSRERSAVVRYIRRTTVFGRDRGMAEIRHMSSQIE